jgi:hypothetical protein
MKPCATLALEFKPEARRALRRMSPEIARRVLKKIETMCSRILRDSKKRQAHSPTTSLAEMKQLLGVKPGRKRTGARAEAR